MTDKASKDIAERLDTMIRLLALTLVKEMKRQDQIELLGKAELSPRDIAAILGTTANTVSVTLSKLRKTKR